VQLYIYDKEKIMFQTTFDQHNRQKDYPNAQDPNFLGYDRDLDRWRVDASGIKIYASGLSVELDKNYDSVAVWSASGTPVVPIYAEDPIKVSIVDDSEPLEFTYGTVLAVPRLTETTVVDYTVPVGGEFLFTTGRATGGTDAEFYLQVDGVNKDGSRSSWCERTAKFDIPQGSIRVTGGSTIRIRVYHEENTSKHGNVDFWGSIAGILK
jgi:hypothetical protein